MNPITKTAQEVGELISKKEQILITAGASRENGAKVIAEAMKATKMIIDKYGEEHHEPDHAMRLRAEELRAREVGDIKPDNSVTNNVQNVAVMNPEVATRIIEALSKGRGNIGQRPTGQTGEVIDVATYK